jgi:hypothetical protein
VLPVLILQQADVLHVHQVICSKIIYVLHHVVLDTMQILLLIRAYNAMQVVNMVAQEQVHRTV